MIGAMVMKLVRREISPEMKLTYTQSDDFEWIAVRLRLSEAVVRESLSAIVELTTADPSSRAQGAEMATRVISAALQSVPESCDTQATREVDYYVKMLMDRFSSLLLDENKPALPLAFLDAEPHSLLNQ